MTLEQDVQWLLESNAELRDRVLGLEGRLGNSEKMVKHLMDRTWGEDTDKMMSVRMKNLESELRRMAFYLLGGLSATVRQPIPQRLKAMEDQIAALGPWIKGLYDEAMNNDGQEVLG